MRIDIKKTLPMAKIPDTGSYGAAGYDLCALLQDFAPEDYSPEGLAYAMTFIEPGETKMIHTGLKVAIPMGYCGLIFARSGLASKRGLRPANCVGVIDSDYRGEIIVALHNDSDECQTIYNGDRIAQLVVMPCARVDFVEVDKLDCTDRGAGGFGSTGI